MKTTKITFGRLTWLVIAVMAVAFSGCKPDSTGELGEPFDKVAGISGTWQLNRFIQKDLNNPIKEERDLSQFYIREGFAPLQITFNGADRSYDVAIETGKNYFGEEGTWRFDDETYPTYITLTTLVNEVEVDLDFKLGSMVREFDNALLIELERGCELGTLISQPTVIYRFEFTRVNE
jgi:hypothetical protein